VPDELVPPVVAVVVCQDPGPWLEECLSSLAAQDYPQLSVLVVDAASERPVAPRVAAVAPDFFLHRLEDNLGFGPSANSVTGLVSGASYYCFCHDDVVLEADVVRRLVEESFRSNAGITGPKLVDHNAPDRLLQLGLGVDRFAAPLRRVERHEFDQAQHDEVSEVFAVPGACTLIRADLFAAIGGFDPQISMFGEDVDLCWRARLASARIVVVPTAVARHLEATAARRRPLPESRSLQWRHELRAVLKNYGRWRRTVVLAQLAVLSALEIAYFFVIGRRDRVHQVSGAWRWNLSSERGLAAARLEVAALRRLPDREVCSLMSHRTFRLWRSLARNVEARALRLSRDSRLRAERGVDHLRHRRTPQRRELSSLVVALVCIFVFGARSLLVGHLPAVGNLQPLPSPATLLGHFFGGFDDAGSQSPGPASPAFLLLGLAGLVTFGAMGVLLKLVLIVTFVAGPIGIARLARPFVTPAARLAAAACYLFLPLAWNDLAAGDLPGLICFAGMPFLVARVLRAAGEPPFAAAGAADGQALRREVVGFSVLLALVGAFVPTVLLMTPLVALVVAWAALFTDGRRAPRRLLGVTGASTLGAVVLLLPWSATFLQRDTAWSVLTGAATDPDHAPVLGQILRLYLGPVGKGTLGWAFLAAALFVLVSGTGARLALAIRMWALLLAFALVTWALAAGWLGPGGGAVRVIVTPLAVAVAVLVGLGAGIVLEEVRSVHLGRHHLTATAFTLCFLAGLLPVLGASLPGRYSLPETGYDSVLAWTAAPPRQATGTRLLWLGDPVSLPGGSWQQRPGLALALSEGGLPTATSLFPSPDPGTVRAMAAAVGSAESGTTVRLGSLLAPYAVRYVVVPSAPAPLLSGGTPVVAAPAPQLVLDALADQTDLQELPVEGGAAVFRNTAWRPSAGRVAAPAHALPPLGRSLLVAFELAGWALLARSLLRGRRARRQAARSRHLRQPHHAVHLHEERADGALVSGVQS